MLSRHGIRWFLILYRPNETTINEQQICLGVLNSLYLTTKTRQVAVSIEHETYYGNLEVSSLLV